ncbi:hypothetical protein CBR_g3549 [Chara braunii]|uniref:D-2-hydroxyglutarate dehydrogenase n=1 Tax=Chara braunii TaxID=69332 RepID=A0A388KFM1_CHABU|nr:hypothetical protein CBR_g3549 [Chara braunii]|eukprot:GBG68855.1 hypothetical protein CBR_g3549 [Chara braunii]
MLRSTCRSLAPCVLQRLECGRHRWRNLAIISNRGFVEAASHHPLLADHRQRLVGPSVGPAVGPAVEPAVEPAGSISEMLRQRFAEVPPVERDGSLSEPLSEVLPLRQSHHTFPHVQHPLKPKTNPFNLRLIDRYEGPRRRHFCGWISSFNPPQLGEGDSVQSLCLPSEFGHVCRPTCVSRSLGLDWCADSRCRCSFPVSRHCNQLGSIPSYHCVTHVRSREFSSRSTETTGVRKEEIIRDASFARLDADDLEFFTRTIGSAGVITDKAVLDLANTDWMRRYKGSGQVVLRPRTTDEVSMILKHCHARRLPVVPQGGNTGMVGGSVPVFDEVILNLGSMDRVLSFDEVGGILTCEAGCTLGDVDAFLEEKGHTMPWDFGSRKTCQIGGNVSTNAGGIHFLRYGSLRALVLGLEVVLADGTVLDMMSEVRKDNTGYDVKQLFIGAEGTLGVITKAAILAARRPSSVHVAFLACNSFEDVKRTFSAARKELGEILSAYEVLDRQSIDLVLKHIEDTSDPLPDSRQPFYILIETSGSNKEHDRSKMKAFVDNSKRSGLFVDGLLAQDEEQMAALWHIRKGVGHALQRAGAHYKYDLSIPMIHFYELVDEMRARLKGEADVIGFGHLGDGNLHLNFVVPKYDERVVSKIEPYVFEWIAARRGSVSAEHGLGRMKADAITYSKPENVVKLMGSVKTLFDPKGILNPYKVLPKWARNDT